MKVLELCGMVSAGKSTFFNEQLSRDPAFRPLSDILPYPKLRESLLKNIFHELTFLILFPTIVFLNFQFFSANLFKGGIKFKKINFLRSYIRKIGAYRYVQRYRSNYDKNTIYIFDEGVFQLIVNSVDIMEEFCLDDHIDDLINWHSVIFFVNDPDTLLHRTKSRRDLSHRLKSLSQSQLRYIFQKTYDRIECFLNLQPADNVIECGHLDLKVHSIDALKGKFLLFRR